MYKNIIASSGLHFGIIILATLSWPFLAKKPIDLPPLISVELIQITDQTNIPYAPKAKKIIEKVKKEQKKLMSGQAPPKKIKKEKPKEVTKLDEKKKIVVENPKAVPKPDKNKEKIKELKEEAIPLPDKKTEVLKSKKETKQNPSKDKRLQKKVKKIQENQKPNIEDTKVKQVSEFEKKEIFDPTNIAALIDKSKEETGETTKKTNKITQSQDINMEFSRLTLSEEDALKAQIFACWSIPLGLPYNENLLVRIKLKLKPDGSVIKTEVLDHARMNKPGESFYKVLAESALRAIQLCQPLRVPTKGYERWKDLQLNFDAREMLGG